MEKSENPTLVAPAKSSHFSAMAVIQDLGIAKVSISDWEMRLLVNAGRGSNP